MNLNKTIAHVNAACVALALPFAADRDARYYLNGIYVAPSKDGGVIVAATDGYTLVCVRDEYGMADRPMILPLQQRQHGMLARRAAKVRVLEGGRPCMVNAEEEITWISPTTEIEGTFPDIFALVGPLDQWKDGLIGSYNPDYLLRVAKMQPKQDYRAIRYFHKEGKDNAALLFTISTPLTKAFGLIMPMRLEERDNSLATVIPSDFRKEAA